MDNSRIESNDQKSDMEALSEKLEINIYDLDAIISKYIFIECGIRALKETVAASVLTGNNEVAIKYVEKELKLIKETSEIINPRKGQIYSDKKKTFVWVNDEIGWLECIFN